MNRSIVRFFLYLLYIALLVFVAGGAGWLLQLLLAFTPLRGPEGPSPTSTDLVRALVLWGVSWVIGLPLVMYFYRLIRRDRKSDPQAGSGGIRALFFNLVEALILPVAVSVAAFAVIEQLGQTFMGDVTGAASFAVLSLVLLAWLEWDRHRAQAGSPAALVFQRLHLYGVQLILLFMLSSTWLTVSRQVIDALVFGSGGATSLGLPAACGGLTVCLNGPNLLSLVGATLWIALFWVGYSWLSRGDHASRWYQATYLAGLAWGLGYLLFGIERGIELLLLSVAGVSVPLSEIIGPPATYDFASPLLFGLIVSGVYGFWLFRAGRLQISIVGRLALWAEAIVATILAVAFWWGIGFVLSNIFESVFGTPPDVRAWMSAVALVVTGLASIPVGIHLHRRSSTQRIPDPLRSFILVLLGGGILTGVIGASVALYLLGTFLLGSPLDHWQQSARVGLAAFLVGIFVLSISLWMAFREHAFEWFQKSRKGADHLSPPPTAEVPVSAPQAIPGEVDRVLVALLVGTITREEASSRILSLIGERMNAGDTKDSIPDQEGHVYATSREEAHS